MDMNTNTIESKNRDNAKDNNGPNKDLLVEITNAESALMERSRQNSEVVNKHIQDNHWNWK